MTTIGFYFEHLGVPVGYSMDIYLSILLTELYALLV